MTAGVFSRQVAMFALGRWALGVMEAYMAFDGTVTTRLAKAGGML